MANIVLKLISKLLLWICLTYIFHETIKKTTKNVVVIVFVFRKVKQELLIISAWYLWANCSSVWSLVVNTYKYI